jgi:RNA polymerase sigma factor (sigma-70 family)
VVLRDSRSRALNDPILAPFRDAGDEEARERAIVSIATRTREIAHRVLRSSQGGALRLEDAADIVSTVTLRIVGRLRSEAFTDDAIASFDAFVATLTFNALHDSMRRRFPEYTRHKNRLRYVLTHDRRLASWKGAASVMAGLAGWRGSSDRPATITLSRDQATPRMLDREAAADALIEILGHAGRPVLLDDLVRLTAELWKIAEAEMVDVSEVVATTPDPGTQLEQRQYLEVLWREIREIRAPQRAALLMNLRDSDGLNALALLLLVGTTTVADIAGAMGMTPEKLGEIWPALPMSDQRIAETLGVTRQQVINLRKSARERLARRMSSNSKRGFQ